MDERVRQILAELAAGRFPRDIPEGCEYEEELRALLEHFGAVLRLAVNISNGDLSAPIPVSGGPLVGSLKALHASLRHLTWQAKQIAQGDLGQRVDFMGEFSDAFNSMVESLSRARQDLLYMSTHDALTGLQNRACFDAELERLGKGRRFPVSIIVADVDGLKTVNDTEGHGAGDAVIRKAASALRHAIRGDDVVARIGGDEFAVVLQDAGEDIAAAAVERILKCLDDLNAAGAPVVSLSLGHAAATCGGELPEAVRLADENMYRHKARNRR
jgi:diguanylate cyclase (GGDEF)-like protein